MKLTFIVRPHSFVDLITNSSSELFVCSGNQDLDAVNDVLYRIIEAHQLISQNTPLIVNDIESYTVGDMAIEDNTECSRCNKSPCNCRYRDVFNSYFGRVYKANYTFNYHELPPDVRAEYEKYNDPHIFWERGGWGDSRSYQNTQRYLALAEEEKELEKKFNVRMRYNSAGLTNPSEKVRDEFWKAKRELWRDWNYDRFLSKIGLFLAFLQINEFTPEQLQSAKDQMIAAWEESYNSYIEPSFKEKEIEDAYEFFSHFTSYMIFAKKGDIIIESNGDNSIPWEVQQAIEGYLRAQRHHMG